MLKLARKAFECVAAYDESHNEVVLSSDPLAVRVLMTLISS